MTSIVKEYSNGLVKLPSWFEQELPNMDKIREMKAMFRDSGLHTVCESAKCPNIGQCWGQGVATFMILGEICTRACRFCAVKAGLPTLVDPDEPRNVGAAVKSLGLRYVVITSVARDDLPDDGAQHFVDTIRAVREANPDIKVEVLIPDFSAKEDSIQLLCEEAPEVVSHNIETVRRLSPDIRSKALHERSLKVLRMFRTMNPEIFVKSSFMVGLGETDDEVFELMEELRSVDCQILTIGQYLAPTRMKRHVRVDRYVTPEQFAEYARRGKVMGFKHVMSAPLVRSSYIAERGYRDCAGTE